jgi:hypothetical protein
MMHAGASTGAGAGWEAPAGTGADNGWQPGGGGLVGKWKETKGARPLRALRDCRRHTPSLSNNNTVQKRAKGEHFLERQ